MPRARMVVAYMQVESPEQRSFRHAALGSSVDEILSEPRRVPVLEHDEGRDCDGRAVYWCAADKPKTSGSEPFFRIAPVYRTAEVSEDAVCEACGIEIEHLKAMFS